MYAYSFIYIHVCTFIHIYTVLARQHCDSISAGDIGGDDGVRGDGKRPGRGVGKARVVGASAIWKCVRIAGYACRKSVWACAR